MYGCAGAANVGGTGGGVGGGLAPRPAPAVGELKKDIITGLDGI